MSAPASNVVPLHNPTAAEILSTLAEAMAFRRPEAHRRTFAGPHPPSAAECDALLRAYHGVEDLVTRQAVLDVLIAASRSGPRSTR